MSNEDEARTKVDEDAVDDLELTDDDSERVAGGVLKASSDAQSSIASNLKAT